MTLLFKVLGENGESINHDRKTLRSGGTATGSNPDLAEDRRPLTERRRNTTAAVLSGRDANAWGAGFTRLALGTLTALAAYIVVMAVRNFRGACDGG